MSRETYLCTKWHLDPWSRLATIDVGRKLGAPPLLGRRLVPHLIHKVAWAEAYLRTKCHLDPSSCLATIDMNKKLGRGLCPLFGDGGAGSPSNTKSTGPRHTSIPYGILVHPAVWTQRTLAENWGLCTFRAGEARSPSNNVA